MMGYFGLLKEGLSFGADVTPVLRGLVDTAQQTRDQILGIQRSEEELIESRAAAYNANIEWTRAELLARRATIESQAASLQGYKATAAAELAQADVMVRGAKIMADSSSLMIDSLGALSSGIASTAQVAIAGAGGMIQAVSAQAQALAAIDEALASLDGLQISDAEIRRAQAQARAAANAAASAGASIGATGQQASERIEDLSLQLADLPGGAISATESIRELHATLDGLRGSAAELADVRRLEAESRDREFLGRVRSFGGADESNDGMLDAYRGFIDEAAVYALERSQALGTTWVEETRRYVAEIQSELAGDLSSRIAAAATPDELLEIVTALTAADVSPEVRALIGSIPDLGDQVAEGILRVRDSIMESVQSYTDAAQGIGSHERRMMDIRAEIEAAQAQLSNLDDVARQAQRLDPMQATTDQMVDVVVSGLESIAIRAAEILGVDPVAAGIGGGPQMGAIYDQAPSPIDDIQIQSLPGATILQGVSADLAALLPVANDVGSEIGDLAGQLRQAGRGGSALADAAAQLAADHQALGDALRHQQDLIAIDYVGSLQDLGVAMDPEITRQLAIVQWERARAEALLVLTNQDMIDALGRLGIDAAELADAIANADFQTSRWADSARDFAGAAQQGADAATQQADMAQAFLDQLASREAAQLSASERINQEMDGYLEQLQDHELVLGLQRMGLSVAEVTARIEDLRAAELDKLLDPLRDLYDDAFGLGGDVRGPATRAEIVADQQSVLDLIAGAADDPALAAEAAQRARAFLDAARDSLGTGREFADLAGPIQDAIEQLLGIGGGGVLGGPKGGGVFDVPGGPGGGGKGEAGIYGSKLVDTGLRQEQWLEKIALAVGAPGSNVLPHPAIYRPIQPPVFSPQAPTYDRSEEISVLRDVKRKLDKLDRLDRLERLAELSEIAIEDGRQHHDDDVRQRESHQQENRKPSMPSAPVRPRQKLSAA